MADLKDKLSELTRLKQKMDQFRPLSEAQVAQLEKNIRIEHVWSSNAIEGSSLNKYETASIINTGMTIHGVPLKDAMAAVDLNQAYDYMMDLASHKHSLDITTIRDLDRLVMLKNTDIRSEAGAYRVIDVWPNGREEHPYKAPYDISFQMDELIKWASQAVEAEHPVKYAADLHFKFVTIHPFVDGNGRTARLLVNFALTSAGYPVINIQPGKQPRTQYMKALADGQDNHDPAQFEHLVADYTIETLKQRIAILERNEENIAEARRDTRLTPSRKNQ